MKTTLNPTNYIIIRAARNHPMDDTDYAIFQITPEWKSAMLTRNTLVTLLMQQDKEMDEMCFTGLSAAFCSSDGEKIDLDELLPGDRFWNYLDLSPVAFSEHFESEEFVPVVTCISREDGAYLRAQQSIEDYDPYRSEYFDIPVLCAPATHPKKTKAMKPLQQLTNVERAKLLHEMFPEEIPAFLHFLQQFAITFREEQANARQRHEGQLFDVAFWLAKATEAEQKIDSYAGSLQDKAKRFARVLFDGDIALFSIRGLIEYVTVKVHPNSRFVAIVNALFNIEK